MKPTGAGSLERTYSTEESVTATAERVRIGPKLWSAVELVMLDLSMLSGPRASPNSALAPTSAFCTRTGVNPTCPPSRESM
jgi:hypothetical protein